MTTTAHPTFYAWMTADRYTRARSCHSLVVRLSAGQDADAVRHRLELVSTRSEGMAGIKLWETWERASANGDLDAGLAGREARRPIGPTGRSLRPVLVHQAGGVSLLVLVAIRSRVPRTLLATLAADLCGTADSRAEASPTKANEPVLSQEAPFPPWGLGSLERANLTGKVFQVIEPSARVGARELEAAVTLVWSRYGPDEVRATGLLPREGQTVSNFLAMFDQESVVQPSAVSVWYQNRVLGSSYLPCLVPVSPMTVIGEGRPDGSVEIVFWYDEGAISPGIARDFAAQTTRAARELVSADAGTQLAGIGTLTKEEVLDVLRRGSGGPSQRQRAPGQTIHECFTKIAARRTDAVAVSDGRSVLTYFDVEERAERIAAGLRTIGVSAGDLVGVCLEQDATLIVAILAVLKCGCAYVPMDVRYPQERLRSTVTDAGLRVVIGDRFPDTDGVRIANVQELEQVGRATSPDDPESADRTPDGFSPAYVIYTSGSTGRPKGTVVLHRNVLALIGATEQDFALGTDDVWTMFHSSAFDFSVWEMWGCLLTGGRLVVTPYWVARSADEFRELLAREDVTVLSQTPSAFSQLVAADREFPPDLSVRLVVFGGEPLDTQMLLPWLKRYPPANCRLINMFGITETTVHVTSHTVTPRDAITGSHNVGRALPGWAVSVRDSGGRVLPPGAAGEIWVSGSGVASHYLGRPELTAQRFVKDPVSGERCYRSGDLGRLRSDGSLDHLGRIDTQVKIRGHRIELGEIRSVLLNEPTVSAAAVVVHQAVPDDPATARIHAFAVIRPGTSATGILANLRRYLPDYMVPANLTAVDSLPVTINGKLDVGRLPPPGAETPTELPTGQATEGHAAEKQDDDLAAGVLEIWRQHLNTEVGLDDNFFELGGNSLLVTRLLADLREQGLPQIRPVTFYQNSTARQFVELVRQVSAEAHSKGSR